MAPMPVTDDYYLILEIEPSADHKSSVSAYRKLAKKVHPDRNKNHNATAAFQVLQRAYETLTDPNKRRAYDLVYLSLKQRARPPKETPKPQPTSTSTTQSEPPSEAAQIAALEKSMQERASRWLICKNAFDAKILVMRRDIRQLQQEIHDLSSIASAEAALEAQKTTWAAWLLSSFNKTVEPSEDDKARKDRERQERRIEIDMKERRLQIKMDELKLEEDRCRKAKQDTDAADRQDNQKIWAILARKMARENTARQEEGRHESAKQQKRDKKRKQKRMWRERKAQDSSASSENSGQSKSKRQQGR